MYFSKSHLMLVALGLTALAHASDEGDNNGTRVIISMSQYQKLTKQPIDSDDKANKTDEAIGQQFFINTEIFKKLPNIFQLLGNTDDTHRLDNIFIRLIKNKENSSWCSYSLSMTMDASKTQGYRTYAQAKRYKEIYQDGGLGGLAWMLLSGLWAYRSTESLVYYSPPVLGTLFSLCLFVGCWYKSRQMSHQANEAYNFLTHNGRWKPGEAVEGTATRPRIPKEHAFTTTQNLSDFSPAQIAGLLVSFKTPKEINDAYTKDNLIPVVDANRNLLEKVYNAVTGCSWSNS